MSKVRCKTTRADGGGRMRTVGDASGDTRQVEEEAAGGVTQGRPWHLQNETHCKKLYVVAGAGRSH